MEEETVESILKFLDEGSKRIMPSPSPNIILVLGDSGTGKSTLTHFLTSTENDLIAEKRGGSGYIIRAPYSRDIICASTMESCTVTPRLVIDHRNNQTYYDCPGFRDTRSVSHDIGTTFFIRKVIDKAEAIKVVFTVNHNSVREGGSRHDFTQLVEHVSTMFKDIKKYENSVCLVVNKVENVYEEVDGQLKAVSDDVLRQDIIEFLKKSKNDLQEKLRDDSPLVEKELLYNQTINLINIFLNEKDPGNPRVGIFKRPSKIGPLGEMKEFQAGRAALQNMIYDKLNYTAYSNSDVRYSISENSKLRLHDIEHKIIENLSEHASTIGSQLVDQYEDQAGHATSVDDLVLELEAGRDKLSSLKHKLSDENMDSQVFMKELTAFLDDSKFIIADEEMQKLKHYSEYLEFVETMSDSTTDYQHRFLNTFDQLGSYLDDSIKWYSFLMDLRLTLSDYRVQHKVENFSTVAGQIRDDFLKYNQQNLTINVERFLVEINNVSDRNYKFPNINEIDKTKWRFFVELLEAGFRPMNTECQETKLTVKGWHVKIADVLNAMSLCDKNVVEIFATNKIFVDADFIKKGGQLIIVSPEVEVVDNRKIILDGEDAPPHVPKKALTISITPGSDGADGLPGLPGGYGGELVVVVRNCKNCDNLAISAVGGKGGKGQDGGDGVTGKGGIPPPMLFQTSSTDDWERYWTANGFNSFCYNGANSRRRRELFTLLIAALAGAAIAGAASSAANANKRIACQVRGLPGQTGGVGGNGGVGGEGGRAGTVSVHYEKSTPAGKGPKVIVKNGTAGARGSGGNGGLGGYYGDNLRQTLRVYINNPSRNTIENSYHESNLQRASSGMPGKPINEVGLVHPKTMKPIGLSNSLKEFKNFVQNMGNAMVQSTVSGFVEYFKVHERSKRSLEHVENVPGLGGIPFLPPKEHNLGSLGLAADGESSGNISPGHPVSYDLLSVHSNLLLVDTLIRKLKGETKKRYREVEVAEPNREYAHFLAYSAYLPSKT